MAKTSYPNRIRARIAEIEATLASMGELRNELDELRVAERVVLRFTSDDEDTEPTKIGQERIKSIGSMTSKDAILYILMNAPEIWLTTQEVQDRVSTLLGRSVPIGTIAPSLSELKNLEQIVRDGAKVAHSEILKNNEASANAEAPINPAKDESDTSMSQSSAALTAQQEKGGIFD
jgi:hypothetical protein